MQRDLIFIILIILNLDDSALRNFIVSARQARARSWRCSNDLFLLLIFSLALGLSACPVAAAAPAQTEQPLASDITHSDCARSKTLQTSKFADFHLYEGQKILSVRFVGVGVFDLSDPSENNALYSWLNRFHSDTKPSTIEPQLLFEVGDALKSSELSETERLLRSLPYLSNAEIFVDEVCPEGVALLVRTRDVWTFEPSFSFGREGGESKHGFGLSEENLFGSGTGISIGYDKTEDRSAVSYAFHSPHLFNTRMRLDLGFTETTDGQQSYTSLRSPFYSLQTPWAFGATVSDVTVSEKIRYKEEDIDIYRYTQVYNEVFGGMAIAVDAEATQRLSAGLTQERETFEALDESVNPVRRNENLIYPWLEYHLIENKFAVYKNLNMMHQVEDISTGIDLLLRVGYAGKQYANTFDAWRYLAQFSSSYSISAKQLLEYAFVVDGREYTSQSSLSRSVFGGGLGYHYLLGDKNRVYLSFDYHQGRNMLPHEQLRIGGEYGLRGYPLDYQRGDKRYLVSLEKRYISNLHVFNLFRVGTVVYLDFGRAWGAGYPPANHLSNLGLGLRFSSSKAKIGHVLHLDLAFPLADKQFVDSYQWVIKASSRL